MEMCEAAAQKASSEATYQCHPERSEGSGFMGSEILRFAQSMPSSEAKG